MNKRNLNKVQKRATQYWFIDGWAEIGMGLICVLLAIYFLMIGYTQSSPAFRLIMTLIIFAVAFGSRLALIKIKEHTTYLRSGYVEPQSWWNNKAFVLGWITFTILLNAFMIFLSLQDPQGPYWPPILGGILFAALFATLAHNYSLVRYDYLAFFCLITGVGLAFSPLREWTATATLTGLTSLILLAFGLITRQTFLSQNPQPPEA